MEKFDFENTTIFKELNELSSEEIKKWVGFILKKNFETEGKYFSNKIGKLKPQGGFKSESSFKDKSDNPKRIPKGYSNNSFFCRLSPPVRIIASTNCLQKLSSFTVTVSWMRLNRLTFTIIV